MALLLTKMENVRTKLKPNEIRKNLISDWGSHLHSIWQEKMALNPGFYDDAKIFHGYRCGCCSHTIILTEERKKK